MMRRPGAGGQRGAVAIFAAIAVAAGLTALALAIDIGRLYSAQRGLQRTANLAALDAARASGGCLGTPDNPLQAARDAVRQSVSRNASDADGITPLQVVLGREYRADDGMRYFDSAEPGQTNQAVHVALTRPAPARLLGVGDGSRKLVASASAHSRPYAIVGVGSRVLDLRPRDLNRVLGTMFGGAPLTVSALGYEDLLDAAVPLDAVLNPDGDRDGDGLFDRIPVSGLLQNLVKALGQTGHNEAAAAAQIMADAAATGREVLPAELVGVARDAAGVLADTSVSAGQLTLSAAQSLNDSALLQLAYTLPPPLGDAQINLRILEPGQQAVLTTGDVGEDQPQYTSTAQGLVQVRAPLQVDALGLSVSLPVWMQLAQATATVTDIQCARSGHPQDTVMIDGRASFVRLGLGEFDDPSGPDPRPQPATLVDAMLPSGWLGLAVPVRLTVTAYGLADVVDEHKALEFTGPFPTDPQSLGGPSAVAVSNALTALASDMDLEVRIVPLDSAGGAPLKLVDPLLSLALRTTHDTVLKTLRGAMGNAMLKLGDEVLTGVAAGAGLTVGGADVRVYDVVAKDPYLFAR